MSIKTGLGKCVPVKVIPKALSSQEYMRCMAKSTEREDCDDPFYLMDIGRLIDLYNLWRNFFPRIKPHYAVKCNDNPVVLYLLAHLGTGFDCASKSEIRQILDIGVTPDNIIFANPCKQNSHIKYAAKKEVSLMTFDNEMELFKVSSNYPEARLIVRICADDPNAICQLGAKFGCTVSEACDMLHTAQCLELKVVGVSFHVGSGCQTPDAYRIALEKAHEVFKYADSIGCHFTVLDIGGGFPGSDKQFTLFQEVAKTINDNIDRLFADRTDLNIIAEPGRYFATSCFSLAVQVTSKRIVESSSDHSFMYYVNDGVYGSFNCLIFDHAVVAPLTLEDTAGRTLYPCSIWGPTCDSLDKICYAKLPELAVGDWIMFEEMGAYTISAHSEFNGFKRPQTYYCVKEEDKITFEQHCSSILSSCLTPSLDAHLFPIEASSLQNNVTTPLSIKGVFELQVACC